MNKDIPAVMCVQDLCGAGRCSLSVALPVLSVMGVQCVALPTAYLSSPTNVEGFTFRDLGDELVRAPGHWEQMGLRFAMIVSGWLGSPAQADAVLAAGVRFPRSPLLVDPVMGDNGQLYRRMDKDMCDAMARLCGNAALITPNVTEAALLLQKSPDTVPATPAEAECWLEALGQNGRSVALTGLRFEEDEIAVAWYDARRGTAGIEARPYVNRAYHGTGDVFTAVLAGALSRGEDLGQAVHRGASFVYDCAAYSFERNAPARNGLLFEPLLGRLLANRYSGSPSPPSTGNSSPSTGGAMPATDS